MVGYHGKMHPSVKSDFKKSSNSVFKFWVKTVGGYLK
jgi:hypothetical protein